MPALRAQQSGVNAYSPIIGLLLVLLYVCLACPLTDPVYVHLGALSCVGYILRMVLHKISLLIITQNCDKIAQNV